MKKSISPQILRDGLFRSFVSSWLCTNTFLFLFNKNAFSTLDFVRAVPFSVYLLSWAILFVTVCLVYFHPKNLIRMKLITEYSILLYASAILIKGMVLA